MYRSVEKTDLYNPVFRMEYILWYWHRLHTYGMQRLVKNIYFYRAVFPTGIQIILLMQVRNISK